MDMKWGRKGCLCFECALNQMAFHDVTYLQAVHTSQESPRNAVT